jgi:hypothetical protein
MPRFVADYQVVRTNHRIGMKWNRALPRKQGTHAKKKTRMSVFEIPVSHVACISEPWELSRPRYTPPATPP